MLKPILKFTGKAKCAFAMCCLLLLATLSAASPTEMYEPTYTKLKTVNNVIHYKIKAKEIPFNKLGIKIDKSVKRYTEQLGVKYNPYRGLVNISTEGINYADIADLYAVIDVYDSDSMWIGKSEHLNLDYSYKNQKFLDSSEVKFAKFINVTLKYKENDDYYFMSERLVCKDGGDTIFYVQTKKNPNGDEEYLLTCDIASLDKNGLYKHWPGHPLAPSRQKFVYLEKYKDCSDTKKYFGLDSTTNECIEIATCLDGEFYDNTDNSCYTIPANSHLIENRLWKCDSGYVEVGNQCLPHVTCSESEIYEDWTETECSTIPSNSHKVDNFTWVCNDGYWQQGDSCVGEHAMSSYVRRNINISVGGGFFNITHIKTNNDKVTHAYESSKPFDMSFGLEYGIQRINTRMNDTLSSLGFNVATGLLLNKRKFDDFYSSLGGSELSPNWYIELGLSLNIYSIGVYAYIRPINCILAFRKIETRYDVLPDSEYLLVNNFGILLGKNFTSHFGLFAGYESLKTIDGPIVPSFEFRARFTF